MGKRSGSRQQVTDYYMSIHFGVATSVDALLALYVNEKSAWEGSVSGTAVQDISINRPDLFGGNKREGGLIGTVTYLPGAATQVMPETLAAKFGLTSTTTPAFRGITSLFFHGGTGGGGIGPGFEGILSAFAFAQLGYAGQAGFQWSSNNPIIAQSVWATVRRAPKGIDPAKAMIGPDANPAHMIYECLTNSEWGMGASPASIDTDSFVTASDTLFDEEFGLSMIWTRQTTIETFVTEVLDHIEASIFVHPRTGLQTLRLIRNDYNPATLPVITPDNGEMDDFQRKFPGEVVNEIVVTWTNPANEQEETVTVQNISAIERQGGQIVSDGRNYYGVRNSGLATNLATRDLRTASAPLATVSMRLLRVFWDVVPGDVVRLQWPSEGGEPPIDLVMRVGQVDYGKPGSPYIQVALIQDVFSLTMPTVVVPPSTQWQDPATPPAPMAAEQVVTLPYYMVTNTAFGAASTEPLFPEVVAGVLASPPNSDTRTYELVTQTVNAAGATVLENIGNRDPVFRLVTTAALAAENVSAISPAGLGVTSAGPLPNGLLLIGGTEATQEIALVTGAVSGNYTVNRGVLDTVPRAWPPGTPVWIVNPGLRIADEQIVRSAGEVATYKLLPTTSLGTLPEASAPFVTGTLTERPYRPLRPANVRVNGVAFGNVAVGVSATVTIDWATRNRLFEDSVIVSQAAGPVSPEYRQRTIVRVYNDATNALIVTYDHLWTENQLVLQKSWFDRFAAIRIEVLAERDGLESFQSTTRRITGFANNPAAPLPPTPPAAGSAPPLATAPGAGAFTLISGTVGLPDGDVAPALLVSGTQNDPDADGLVVRYKLATSPDWALMPTVALTGASVSVEIAPVAANATYDVEIAYLYTDGTPSQWRSLGQAVTANVLISGVSSAALVADAATAKADSASALSTLNVITSDAVLSRDEKPGVRQQRDTIVAEFPSIRDRADSFGVSRVTYAAAYNDLIAYLSTVALDSATDTGIVRSTFNGRFVDYYSARQTVLDGIALVASQRANLMPANANRVPFSLMENDKGWKLGFNPAGISVTQVYSVNAGRPVFVLISTPTSSGQTIVLTQSRSPQASWTVAAGERLSVQATLDVIGQVGSWSFGVQFVRADGSRTYVEILGGSAPRAISQGPVSSFIDVPSSGSSPIVGGYLDLSASSSAAGTLQIAILHPMVTSAAAAQTIHPAFSPGPNAADGADVTRDTLPTLNKGDWSPGLAILRGDIYRDNGSTYTALLTHNSNSGNRPPNATFWALVAQAGINGIDGADGAPGPQGPPGVSAPPVKSLSTGAAQFDPIRLVNGQTVTAAAELFLDTGGTVGTCSLELQITPSGTGTWATMTGGLVSDTQPTTEPVELAITGATFTNTSGEARLYDIRAVSVRRSRTVNTELSGMRVI